MTTVMTVRGPVPATDLGFTLPQARALDAIARPGITWSACCDGQSPIQVCPIGAGPSA